MWLELHDSARDHPKVLKLARDLNIDEAKALGHLCCLWTWSLRMAPDGDLSSFDIDDIEIGAKWDGESGAFVECAYKRKLLDLQELSYVLHDWPTYAHHLKAAQWKRDERARKKAKCQSTSADVQSTSVDGGGLSSRPTDPPDRPIKTNSSDSVESVSEQISKLESRYSLERELLAEIREACSLSRKNGKMADTVWLRTLQRLSAYPTHAVIEAMHRYVEKHADGEKSEAYLVAIAKGISSKAQREEPILDNSHYAKPDGASELYK